MLTQRNLWPFGLIAAFVLFIAGTASLVVLASSHNVDLVSPDYYDQEIRFQNHLDRVARTAGASIAYDAARKAIVIALPSQMPGGVEGRVQLYRPSAAALDREIKFSPDATGVQSIDAAQLATGLWKVRVSWSANGVGYFAEKKIVIGAAIGNRQSAIGN